MCFLESPEGHEPQPTEFQTLCRKSFEKGKSIMISVGKVVTLPLSRRRQTEVLTGILDSELLAKRISQREYDLLAPQLDGSGLRLLMLDIAVGPAGGILTTFGLPPIIMALSDNLPEAIKYTTLINISPVSPNGIFRASYSAIRSLFEIKYLRETGKYSWKHPLIFSFLTVGNLVKATYFLTPFLTYERNKEFSLVISRHYLAELCLGRTGQLLRLMKIVEFFASNSHWFYEYLRPLLPEQNLGREIMRSTAHRIMPSTIGRIYPSNG